MITQIEWWAGTETGDNATIFWGSMDGLSDEDATDVPTVGGVGCSIWDLDLDGHQDLVIANLSDGSSYDVDSRIYWGTESGLDLESWTNLPAHSANAVVTHPLEDGY